MDQATRAKLRNFIIGEFAKTLKEKINIGYGIENFNINPFTSVALSSGVLGDLKSINLAKSLIYPRVFGTSITTNFGDRMQKLCIELFDAKPSGVSGMDIEFTDKTTNKNIIMQLKAGPNTINSKDVEPILKEMLSAYRLLKQNGAKNIPIFSMGITYGELSDISAHYKKINKSSVAGQTEIPIFIGQNFWHRLTGNKMFYSEMINLFIETFEKEDYSKSLEEAIKKLADLIEKKYFVDGKFNY